MNEMTSVLEAVAVIVGAVPPGQRAEVGHVKVREPVASCLSSNVNCAPAVGVGKVNVQLPVKVRSRTDAAEFATVYAVPVFATATVSLTP